MDNPTACQNQSEHEHSADMAAPDKHFGVQVIVDLNHIRVVPAKGSIEISAQDWPASYRNIDEQNRHCNDGFVCRGISVDVCFLAGGNLQHYAAKLLY